MPKYTVTPYPFISLLGNIKAKEIAVPEIQRPFVWDGTQVRDFIDSLYRGYPVGYLIIWKNPNVRQKDGSLAKGKLVLIDGQQRVMALMTSILGEPVLTDEYEERVIKIAFNPLAKDDEERFAVQTPAHVNSREWIEDISVLFDPALKVLPFLDSYMTKNPDADRNAVWEAINALTAIQGGMIGVITLDAELDINEVTEIFVRINSKGTKLNEADFAMSKIAADEQYGGNMLRKAIDYFCHLAVKPDFYASKYFKKDTAFASSEYYQKMSWIKDDHSAIYDPAYSDMLRVSFMYAFQRGKLADLVSLLSGRDFTTKTFREEIAADSFAKLKAGVHSFMADYNFKQFVLAIDSAGFKYKRLHVAQNTLNFCYALQLMLKDDKKIPAQYVKNYVQRWLVMSFLTGRYAGSPETQMHHDLREIVNKGFLAFLEEVEASQLSDTFWDIGLPQRLNTSSSTSPAFITYLAALVKNAAPSLFKPGITVQSLLQTQGDFHHIFPRAYLRNNGIEQQYLYNQVANYAVIDKPLNIDIKDRAPSVYFSIVMDQCSTKEAVIGDITDEDVLKQNLADNDIPEGIFSMTAADYGEFLRQRRILMAHTIRDYYKSL